MSKDGDWVIRETPDACGRVLVELERRGARYRLGAPLDVRWLAGGWSSHFEFSDDRHCRVRCDFLSRPPRVPLAALNALFTQTDPAMRLSAIDAESLILMKQTQRAKDYADTSPQPIVPTGGGSSCADRKRPARGGRGAGRGD